AADGADLPSLAAGGAGSLRVAQLDVTRPGSFEVPAELRVLVNNAGIERENLPVEVLDLVHWRELFETNVFGTVEMTRRAIPALRAAGGGVICNATSASLLVPMPFFSPYRASKAAVAALGESLQAEVAPFGIRVVEVLPGPVDTDMLRASSEVPEGIEVEGYRALAELVGAARAGFTGSPASPAEAADRIVAAILDDGAPLRVACDPIGDGLLEAWRTT